MSTKSKKTEGEKLIYIHGFFKALEVINSFSHDGKLSDLIENLINDDEVSEIIVDWAEGQFYECYHHDFMIGNHSRIIFIHLGGYD